jgi:hypothetical protein
MVPTNLSHQLIAALADNRAGLEIARLLKNLDVGCEFTVGAEAGNVVNVAGQLVDSAGNAVTGVKTIQLALFTTAAGVAFNATNYTTIAIGTKGALLETIADKLLIVRTDANGAFDINITLSSGAATSYMALLKPDGTIDASGVITHAA